MRATFPTDLLLRFLQATPEVLAVIEPLLPPLPGGEAGAPVALAAPLPVAGSLPPRPRSGLLHGRCGYERTEPEPAAARPARGQFGLPHGLRQPPQIVRTYIG